MQSTAIETYNNFYADANLSQYAGKWVVIIKNKVISHGENLADLVQQAKKEHPAERPFIAKVPTHQHQLW